MVIFLMNRYNFNPDLHNLKFMALSKIQCLKSLSRIQIKFKKPSLSHIRNKLYARGTLKGI